MLPVTEKRVSARTKNDVHMADDYLERVLAGKEFLLFDGGMGTMLQQRGLATGALPELLCLSDPDAITDIHRAYVEAGSQAVTTNTFGANARKLAGAATVDEVFAAAIRCARASGARYVAADIGPTGTLLEPLGTTSFDEVYELFAEQVQAAAAHKADFIVIETMSDLLEMKAAVLAAKENCDLPVFATMTFGEDGRTFLGTSPRIAAVTLTALGVNALGINCSLGPAALAPLVNDMLAVASCPVMVQANAGLPSIVEGKTVYSIGPEEYARAVEPMIAAGASIIGGCCGTDPAYIAELAQIMRRVEAPAARSIDACTSLTSAQKLVELRGREVAIIGERINPTGKKKLKEALREGNDDYVVEMALDQVEQGADILDVNAGLPEIDEAAVLAHLVTTIQGVCDAPLQIDSASPAAIERAVRVYAGKPLVNSVNGKRESLDAVLPIAAHYGCAIVGLTLDENGIPSSVEQRLEIARRIVNEAARWGIPREDIFIDCLTMAASTNQKDIPSILHALTVVKEELGVRCTLGVSNVSFGLPAREVVNTAFLAAAFAAGLDAPILNPANVRYRETVDAWRLLCGQDEGCARFVDTYADYVPVGKRLAGGTGTGEAVKAAAETASTSAETSGGEDAALREAVISGRKGSVAALTSTLIATSDALTVINECLIPALDVVGQKFESGTFFLPQLMASAEAAKVGFSVVQESLAAQGGASAEKGPIALATVKGDIHDIGKNIVRMLLENYGYKVYDLGRDVDPQAIVDCVRAHNVKLVGLSALMTTTVANMAETIEVLHRETPDTKVFVGGAVLNEEYAQLVGADYYTKDAAASARLAESFFA